MKKAEKEQLILKADKLRGRRSVRFISKKEIEEMAKLDRKKKLAGQKIRVYSEDGFVANSYFGNPAIDFVERTFVDGEKVFSIGQCGAKRSYGSGSLVTVNGKGV